MREMEIKILDLGCLATVGEELVAGMGNEPFSSPVSAVLIRHPEKGYILYDTGNDENWRDTYPEAAKKVFPVERLVRIIDALKKECLTPDDIDTLVLSHLHFDHVGGLRYFQGTKAAKNVIVSEAELRDGLYRVHLPSDGIDSAYSRKLFCGLNGVGFRPMSGKMQIAKGVILFEQQSHTAGVLGMEIELEENGTIIFTGDTVYTKSSYENLLPPGGDLNTSTKSFRSNIDRLRKKQKEKNATVIFGHDPDQMKEWEGKGWIH